MNHIAVKLFLQFNFFWSISTETANVRLLISPRPTPNSLYFIHDLFMWDIYQGDGIYHEAYKHSFHVTLSVLQTIKPFLFCSKIPWAWNLSFVHLHDQKKFDLAFPKLYLLRTQSINVDEAVQTSQSSNPRTYRKIYPIENNAIQFNRIVLLKQLVIFLSKEPRESHITKKNVLNLTCAMKKLISRAFMSLLYLFFM